VDAEHYKQDVHPGAPDNAHALVLELVGYNQRVLEFGCAAGHVTRALAARGCSVVGLEVNPAAAEIATRHADDVLVVDLDHDDFASKLAGREFDVALFGDVLEHLRDPLEVLRSVRQLLAPGTGFVVLSVPNVAHVDVRLALLNGEFEYRPRGLLDETHLRFFTRASVDRLVDQAGLVPVELRRVICPVFASELGVDRDRVEPAVLAVALADPEAETYQFVIKAVPSDAASAVAGLAGRVLRLEDELRTAAIERAFELAEAERRAEEATEAALVAEQGAMRAHAETEQATEAALVAEQGAMRAHAETELLRRTRLVRWSAPARRLYAFLRRRG
jgi:2-polyprenyl-3-methyl-5-hydroxy-6-metoxy-1,4-benzoquinol methylase